MADEIQKTKDAVSQLLGEAQTILISVPGEEHGMAELGVSPFIQKDGHIYIYASRLSAHIRQLLGQSKAVFMMVADEARSQNIWARHRLKFTAHIAEVPREDKRFIDACDAIGAAHGPVMDLIRDFTDFHLFEITPDTGVFVRGFGAAFAVSGPDFTVGDKLQSS